MWALLSQNFELAEYFWKYSDENPIVLALVAALICSNLRNKTTKGSEKNKRCKKYKVEFEQTAVKIFEKVLRKKSMVENGPEMDDEKERQIQKLLTDELPAWERMTVIELAILGKCRKFIGQERVREILSVSWWGEIDFIEIRRSGAEQWHKIALLMPLIATVKNLYILSPLIISTPIISNDAHP